METTAIYPNRIEDKERLESKLKISEFSERKRGFVYQGCLIARGYNRVVYGDHGPYVEFKAEHIVTPLVDRFGRSNIIMPEEKDAKFYYFWLNPLWPNPDVDPSDLIAGTDTLILDLKVYWQIKPVTNLPNAPRRADGKKSNFNRAEGYADYKRGLYYIDPYEFDIE